MIVLHTPAVQSPLAIFIFTILSGIIGYYVKHLIDLKKSKLLKILTIDMNISRACVKSYNPKGYIPPIISLKLENLSQTDIEIQGIILRNRKQYDIFPTEFSKTINDTNIKQYEIKQFSYELYLRKILNDKNNPDKINASLIKLETPGDFFFTLYWYLYNSSEITEEWKNFNKKLSLLEIQIKTNIGEYKRKLNKKELVMFRKILKFEFEKNKKL